MSEKAYNIKFVGIELLSKSIVQQPHLLKEKETFTFNFLVEVKLDPSKKQAAAISTVTIFLVEEKTTLEVAIFKILCVFEFPDFDSVFTKMDDQKYSMPLEIEILLKATGVSTIRGVIASEVRGTYLHEAVLPLIDMNTVVREQKKKEKEEKEK